MLLIKHLKINEIGRKKNFKKNSQFFYLNVIAKTEPDQALTFIYEGFMEAQIYNDNLVVCKTLVKSKQHVSNENLMKNCLGFQKYLSNVESYGIIAFKSYEVLLVFRNAFEDTIII